MAKSTSDPLRRTNDLMADYRWLTSEQAVPWLARAAEGGEGLVKLTQSLRSELSASRTHLILEQVELRQRAQAKFANAARMFFTRVGLEQATDEIVAAYKAARFPTVKPVADLCCGIGGDCLGLAARGPTVGVDRDPILAHFAQANFASTADGPLSLWERAGVRASEATCITICIADVEQFSVADFSAWHIDPDRRPQGQRTTRVELHEPGPEVIAGLLQQCPHAAVKLAPAAELPSDWEQIAEAEWLSRDGECKQLVVWFGSLARNPGLRAATIMTSPERKPATSTCRLPSGTGPARQAGPTNTHSPRTIVGQAHQDYASAQAVGRYVYEVDAAVLAAKLTGVLAAEHALAAIDPHGGYLTGDRPIADVALAPFEVLEVLPFDRKRLKAALQARNIGRLEIKKRALLDDPEKLRRDLALAGDETATLLLSRVQDRATAIIAKRVDAAEKMNP